MTQPPRDELTSIVFRALYSEFDLISIGVIHIVTPRGVPVFVGDSLGDIARQISGQDNPEPPATGVARAELADTLPRRDLTEAVFHDRGQFGPNNGRNCPRS
jgi:hypothetical protein